MDRGKEALGLRFGEEIESHHEIFVAEGLRWRGPDASRLASVIVSCVKQPASVEDSEPQRFRRWRRRVYFR
jgi:hypothetical protein